MRKIIIGLLLLLSVGVTAQWQQTGSKVRYVNGLGIPTKDTAAGVAADSSQILIRPADSSLYVKYKRTWVKVGGGTVSGTTNYVPKFTSSSAIGNSQIFDNGTSVGIGTIPSAWRSGARAIQFGANGFGALWEQGSGAVDLSFASYESATNTFLYKTTGDLPTLYQQVTGNHAWYNAPSGTAGNPITFNERMRITSAGDVGIGTTGPDAKLRVAGTYNGTQAIFGFTDGRGLLIGTGSNGTNEALSIFNARGAGAGMLQFQTDGTDRVRIDNSGNVGIGTTSPSEKLHLVGNTFRQNDASNSFGYTISTTSATTTLATLFGGSSFGIRTGGSGSDNMRITSGGNALIGTTTDNGVDKLQVSGSMNVSTLATTNNLSVTTNATVGGTLKVTGSTTLGTTNTGALTASSLDVTSGSGTFANLYSNGLVQMLGVNVKYRNISATYTATTGDDYFINITSGTFTLNLPTAATPYGQVYVIKNSGTGTVTLDPFSTQTIDGSTTVTMNVQNQTYTIIGDGSNWKIVSKYL